MEISGPLSCNPGSDFLRVSLVVQSVKNPPAVQEARVLPLGQEEPLEKEMATRSSILAWRIPWTEEPGGLQSTGSQRIRHDLVSKQQQQMMYGKLCLEILSYFISEVLIEHRLCIRLEDGRKEISETSRWSNG